MIDSAQLLQALRINGVTNETPLEIVDSILNSLKYSPEEKNAAFELLKSQGWNPGVSAMPTPVAPEPTLTMPPVPQASIAPISAAPITPVVPVPEVMQSTATPVMSIHAAPSPVDTGAVIPEQKKLPVLPIILTCVVLIALVVGGVFAYSMYKKAPGTATEFIQRSLDESMKVKSFAFVASSSGMVTNQIGQGIPSNAQFTAGAEGAIDMHSVENPIVNIDMYGKIFADTGTTTGSMDLSLSTIYREKNLYLDLNKFVIDYNSKDKAGADVKMFVTMINGFAAPLQGKWIKIPMATTSSSMVQGPKGLSLKNQIRVRDYIRGMSYVQSVKDIGSETVSSVATKHVQVTILPGQQFVDLFREISLEEDPSIIQDMPAFEKRMADVAKSVNEPAIMDVWMGQSDYLIYKVVIAPVEVSESETGSTVQVSQEMTFSEYNKAVVVPVPQDAMPIEELMKSIFGGMGLGAL